MKKDQPNYGHKANQKRKENQKEKHSEEQKKSLDDSDEVNESDMSIETKMRLMIENEKKTGVKLVNINTNRLENFRKQRQLDMIKTGASEFEKKHHNEIDNSKRDNVIKGLNSLSVLMLQLRKRKFIKRVYKNKRYQENIIDASEQLQSTIALNFKFSLFKAMRENQNKKRKAEEEEEKRKNEEEAQRRDQERDRDKDKDKDKVKKKEVKLITPKEEEEKNLFSQQPAAVRENKEEEKQLIYNNQKQKSKSEEEHKKTQEQLKQEIEKEKNKLMEEEKLRKELEKQRKLIETEKERQTKIRIDLEQEKETLLKERKKSEDVKLLIEKEKEIKQKEQEARNQKLQKDMIEESKNFEKEIIEKKVSPPIVQKKKYTLNLLDNDTIEEENNKSIDTNPKMTLENTVNIHQDQLEIMKKIEDKEQKLKSKLKKQKEYFEKLENQMKAKTEEIDQLTHQIGHQKHKKRNIVDGKLVSMTESITSNIDEYSSQGKGLTLLEKFFANKIREVRNAFFFIALGKRKRYTKKVTNKLDFILSNKLREETEDLFNEEMGMRDLPFLMPKRKTRKENTGKMNEIRKLDLVQSDSEDNKKSIDELQNKYHFEPRQTLTKKQRKLTTPMNLKAEEINYDMNNKQTDDDINRQVTLTLDEVYTEESDEEEEEGNEEENQLLEYDKFYKEDFFKDEMFKQEDKDAKDKEEEEIKKETARRALKKKIKELERKRENRAFKGLDCVDLDIELKKLKDDYNKSKHATIDTVELQMNNTDALLYKGRILFNYFNGDNKKQALGIPKFSIESEKDVKGKEIIQFKQVRKEEKARRYWDRGPCLEYRKKLFKGFAYTKHYCNLLVNNVWFEYFSLLVIITNTILILVSEPTDPNNIANTSDSYFLYFYTLEAILKILAFGFICEEFAYLKDYWNCLDFLVIFVGWISFILEKAMEGQKISGLSGLRAFRILRPLKTVKSVKGLKNLVVALIASILKLSDTSIVLFFFYLIFAIGGVQMWSGIFLKRCMSVNYGYIRAFDSFQSMCTFDSDCIDFNEPGNRFICIKGFLNPDNGTVNFDNTLIGFITIFIVTTMEGWTNVFLYVSRTFKDKFYINPIIIFLFFHVLLFVGGYYLVNLFLAVTNSEFTKVETERKEAMSKKSFYLLIKSKYDLKEKEKQEKKKKERELKLKNQDKCGETLKDLRYRIKDEAFHIRKNINDIPINYDTVKDLYIFQNDNPEVLARMDELIDEEEKYLCQDIKKQVADIDKLIKQNKEEKKQNRKAKIESNRHKSSMLSSEKETAEEQIGTSSKFSKRKPTTMLSRPVDKMYPAAIELCISYTQQWLKDEMINLQKIEVKRSDTADLLKQKIEKKELEKFNMNQVTIKEDLSFEKERKKKRDNEDPKKNSYHIPRTQLSNIKVPSKRNSQLVSQQVINEINKRRNQKKIIDELSFMTDLSGKEADELIDDDTISQFTNSIETINNDICARKRTLIKDDVNLYQEITFNHPDSILPALLQLKNDNIVQKKLDIMRKKFDVNEYLTQAAKNGENIKSIGRRKSFLNFLQYPQERANLTSLYNIVTDRSVDRNKLNLDISLYNDEDKLSLNSKSFSDLDILPQTIPENSDVYDENFEFEELTSKIESNRYASIARKSILDKTGKMNSKNLNSNQMADFYTNVNVKMTSNIKIDLKEPRGRGQKSLTKSHVFVDDGQGIQIKDNETSALNTKKTHTKEHYSQTEKKKKSYLFKSPSIEKNLWKYPQLDSKDLIVEEKNKRKEFENICPDQEMIPMNLRTRKYYMNYLFNIKDKDLAVKDDFKVDSWRQEILGFDKKLFTQKKLPESKEAVFVFNNKALNLKRYKYLYNKKFEYLDHEYAVLTHHLSNLPINILELMPPRVRDFGRFSVGKDINLGTLSTTRSGMKSSKSAFKFSQSTFSNSSANRSRSVLCVGSTFSNSHRYLDDIKYKKGFYEKLYRKLDDFNYKTLSHYFLEEENLYFKLTDEKRREDKEREKEEAKLAKDSVIEVKAEVKAIKIFDLRTNSRRYILWSGQDVLYKENPDNHVEDWNKLIYNLENFEVIIWTTEGSMKILQKIRYGLYLISTNQWIDYSIMLLVVINAIIMALDGNLFTPEKFASLSVSNYVFNAIFIAEFVIKFFGLGPIVYFSDAFTYLDIVIIAFAILDMAVPDTTSTDSIGGSKKITSQLGFLRVFRIFRVLRLTKILRRMKSMRLIIVSIKKSLANVAYIILILIMFILIFQLLGMSILSANKLYQSFMPAFYVTFQVLTIENWDGILSEMFPLSPFVFLYYLIWIILGNYILFNLFISILLQSFEGDDHDEDDEDENEIIERRFNLPDYFVQLKNIEKEHKNRLKEKKKGAVVKTGHNKRNSISTSASRVNSSANISGSSANNTSASSLTQEETEHSSDEESDSRVLTGVDKTLHQWNKLNQLYKRNECEYSLYMIKQHNPARLWCMKLQSMKRFDHFILVMILLSTARLIIDTFISGYTSVLVFDILDIIFTLIFLFEMIIKIIALGFVVDEGTYLRDNWNKIDLIIVIVSLVDFQSLVSKYAADSQGSSSLNFLKVLRLLRTLRPLRFISHNVQLKLIITSLFDSILPICNALFIVLIVFFMFSIVGMNLFYNLYHNCFRTNSFTSFIPADPQFSTNLGEFNIENNAEAIQEFCSNRYNGILDSGPNFKFSNIFISLMTSYVLGNMEGWPDIMNSYRVFNEFYGLFFVIYVLVVSYFFLNLFTGIMFKYFNLAWSREKKISDDDKHAEKYFDFLKQVEFVEPEYNSFYCPKEGSIRYYLFMFVNSKLFDNFIMGIILLNMISMAINFDYSPKIYTSILDDINIAFTAIFIAECILKLIALGPVCYFFFGWNRFDFFVVLASIVDLVFLNIDDIDASFLKSFQIIRVLRVLRVTRVLRLIKSLKGLEKLIQTLRWSVTALMNVFILMFLIFCIFAILGCYLYDGITYEKYKKDFIYVNQYYNFDNFYTAFLFVFRCATGEAWPMLMLDLAYIDENKVSANQAFIFMIIMNFFSAVIMLNLFLMVTLQQYDEFTNKTYNPVEKFDDFASNFKKAWNKYSSSKDKGYRIKKLLIPNCFLEISWKKLQFPENNKLEHIKKYVSELKLRSDQENYVYFHDVLFKIIVKQLGSKIDRFAPENSVILKEEKKLAELIKKKINNYILKHEINKNKLQNPLSTFNPLTSHLYFKISYLYMKTFINYYKENAEYYMNEDNRFGRSLSRSDDDSDSRSDPLTNRMERSSKANLIDDDPIRIQDNINNIISGKEELVSQSHKEKTNRSEISGALLINNDNRESEKLL